MFRYPELDAIASTAERQRLLSAAWRDVVPRASTILLVVACEIIPFAALYFGLTLLRTYLKISFPFPIAVAAMFLGFVNPFLFVRLVREPMRKSLRRQLAERGVPVCVPCGYDLRGLTERRCPECGAIASRTSTAKVGSEPGPRQ